MRKHTKLAVAMAVAACACKREQPPSTLECQAHIDTARQHVNAGERNAAIEELSKARTSCPANREYEIDQLRTEANAVTERKLETDETLKQAAAKRFLEGVKRLKGKPREVDKGQPECSGPGELDAGWCLTSNYADLQDGEVKEAFYLKRDPKVVRFMAPSSVMPKCEMFGGVAGWTFILGGGSLLGYVVCEISEGELSSWKIILTMDQEMKGFIRAYAPGYATAGPFSDERRWLSGKPVGKKFQRF